MHGRKVVTTGTVATLALLAILGGCGEATSGPTSVKPEDFASSLRLLSGNQQTGAVGAVLAEVLTVKVVDAGGQPVAGATVLWQVRSGGGSISPAASTSSVSGLASVTWTLGTTLGANKAVAILHGNYVRDSVVFTATAGVGPASRLTLVSGNAQTGRVASVLAQKLTINVKDQFGYAISGKTVAWLAANFSGTVVADRDTTDASGNVSAVWTLGQTAMVQSASASVTGIEMPVAFTATATADTSRVIMITAGNGQTAAVGATLATTLQVAVHDRFGNPIEGESVVFNDSLTAGGSVSPVTATTNASGRATSAWTLGTRLGPQLARARVSATVKATFNATATTQFAQVYAGNYFTCGVTTGDRAFCWGFGEDGQRGYPAAKTTNQPGAAVTTTDSLAGPFQTWRQIGAGTSYVCGISIARQMYCWGRLASATQAAVPTLQSISSNVVTFESVSTSESHSCALMTDGRVACTGSNSRGQLGDGLHTDRIGAWWIVGTVSGSTDSLYSSIVTGARHTCAFPRYNPADSANTKRPRCWGDNSSGQLGRGTVSVEGLTIVPMTMPSTSVRFDSTSLVAGVAHTCALTTAGDAYCWGANGYGQIGGGSALVRDSVPLLVTGGYTFSKLYAGEYHTCGITTAGYAYCWGRNTSGQLGDGSTTNSNSPVAASAGRTFRSLALGELHTCGVANSAGLPSGTQAGAGVVYCWGDNEYGQLGLGVTGANGAPTLTPQKVAGQP